MFQIDIEALQIKSSKNEWHMCIVCLENSKSNVGNLNDHSRSKYTSFAGNESVFFMFFFVMHKFGQIAYVSIIFGMEFFYHFQNGILSLS